MRFGLGVKLPGPFWASVSVGTPRLRGRRGGARRRTGTGSDLTWSNVFALGLITAPLAFIAALLYAPLLTLEITGILLIGVLLILCPLFGYVAAGQTRGARAHS
jgi:hypothetical protein